MHDTNCRESGTTNASPISVPSSLSRVQVSFISCAVDQWCSQGSHADLVLFLTVVVADNMRGSAMYELVSFRKLESVSIV